MLKTNPLAGYDDLDEVQDDEAIKPLSRSEAQALREKNPMLSPWVVLAGQACTGLVVALVAWLLTGRSSVGWSALYGTAAVVIPGAIFARGLMGKASSVNSSSAVAGFFIWEIVKIGVTVAMLVAARNVVSDLSWLALLAGFVVTMKVYWLAVWLRFKRPVVKNN